MSTAAPKPPKCACGTPKILATRDGLLHCPHCDRPCLRGNVCDTCRALDKGKR